MPGDQLSGRKFIPERAFELRVRIAHEHGADAFRGRGDEQSAERRVPDRIRDVAAGAATPIRLRLHRELRRGVLVETAARHISGVEHRVRDARAGAQSTLHLPQPARVGVLARRHADDPFEAALEVIGTPADARCETRQRQMAVDVRQIHARATDFFDPWIARVHIVRPAPPARAVTRAPGVVRRFEKRDAIAPWTAARARRLAVHARGRHGVDEGTIGTRITSDDGVPAILRGWGGPFWGVVAARHHHHHACSVRRTRRTRYPNIAVKPAC